MRYKAINHDDNSPQFGVFLNWGNGIQVLSNPAKSLQQAIEMKSPIVQDELKAAPFLFEDYLSAPRHKLHLKKVRLFKKVINVNKPNRTIQIK